MRRLPLVCCHVVDRECMSSTLRRLCPCQFVCFTWLSIFDLPNNDHHRSIRTVLSGSIAAKHVCF